MNRTREQRLEPEVLGTLFETLWPRLEQSIADVLADPSATARPEPREDRQLLEEILERLRGSLQFGLSDQHSFLDALLTLVGDSPEFSLTKQGWGYKLRLGEVPDDQILRRLEALCANLSTGMTLYVGNETEPVRVFPPF